MAEFKSVDDVLDFAIAREEEAAEWYTEMAGKMEKQWMKKVFEDFAKEEKGHKAKLLQVKEGKMLMADKTKVMDLKMTDYLVAEEPGEDMDYQQALILAMHKEKAAFRLYMDLSDKAGDERLAATLRLMAQEEAKHRLRFELEYDEHYSDSKY